MAKLHAIEKELIKATGFKKDEDDFKKRDDYLAALAKEVNKLPDDEFNALSDPASDWANNALDALKADEDIPDFDADDGKGKDDDKDDRKSSKDKDDDRGSRRSSKDKDDDGDKKGGRRSSKDDDDDRKGSKRGRDKDDDKPKRKSPRDYEGAKRDRYGLVVGSKVSDAVALFEKGASMKTIKEKTGGPQNNVLKTLTKAGHLVERYDGLIKVTHKDDLSSAQKRKVTQAANKSSDKDDDGDRKRGRDDDDDRKGRRSSKDDDDGDKKSSRRSRDDDDRKSSRSSKDDDDRGSRRRSRDDDDDKKGSSKRSSRKDDDDDRKGGGRRRSRDD